MPETELFSALANLGAAGLIGWMWITERRAAATRDAQIAAAHDRIRADEQRLVALLSALDANTRALAALQAGQDRLIHAIERLIGPQAAAHALGPALHARTAAPPSAIAPPAA